VDNLGEKIRSSSELTGLKQYDWIKETNRWVIFYFYF